MRRAWLLALAVLLATISVGAADDEVVLVEDISDDEVDIARSYVKANLSDILPPKEKPPPTSPPRPAPPKSETPSHQTASTALAKAEQLLGSLQQATVDYAAGLVDADHIDTMARIRQEAYGAAGQALAEASRGVKADAATFQPLVAKAQQLQAQLQQMKRRLQSQVALHLELMERTQDVLSHVDPKANKALRTYINQRIKKRKASSRENLLEMQGFQRKVRGKWLLGATTRELRFVALLSAGAFAVYAAGKVGAQRLGQLKLRSLPVNVAVGMCCCSVAYYAIVATAVPYLTKRHLLLQVAALMALGAGLAVGLDHAEGLLLGPLRKPRPRKLP